jgi:hypothetical protein
MLVCLRKLSRIGMWYVIQCVRKVAVHLGYSSVRYEDLVFSIEVAVEVCSCFTVFSC